MSHSHVEGCGCAGAVLVADDAHLSPQFCVQQRLVGRLALVLMALYDVKVEAHLSSWGYLNIYWHVCVHVL